MTDHPTEPIVVRSRRLHASGPAVVRALSGITVLAVLATATWYAGDDRRVVVTGAGLDRPVSQVTPSTVGTTAPTAAPRAVAPAPATPAAPSSAAGPAPAAAVAISPGAGGTQTTTVPGASAPGSSSPGGAVPGGSTPIGGGSTPIGGGGAAAGGAGFATPPVAEQAACPIALPKPDRTGGLSSIVELSPMFGPFASEVFSLGSAIQPVMQLAGPLLAELEPVIHQNLPWLTPILNNIAGAGQVVLQAILPFYGPYRDQFIASEGQFAAGIAPVLTKAYQSPAAACLVDWEGQIVRSARGGVISAPSLTHPGQVVRLGPKG